MSTLSAGEVLQARYASFKQKQCNDASSIENKAGNTTNNTSIELPQEIKALITGNDFWVNAKSNRYKKLIREGHLDKLLELAKMARVKNNPANWFAKACSKATWERTLAYFAKLKEVARKAEHVARRLGTKVNKFIYEQIRHQFKLLEEKGAIKRIVATPYIHYEITTLGHAWLKPWHQKIGAMLGNQLSTILTAAITSVIVFVLMEVVKRMLFN